MIRFRSFSLIAALLTVAVPYLLLAGAPSSSSKAGATLPQEMIKSFKARSIGPAVMGGRISTIALDPEEGATYYIGLGTGGVMKTTSNGASFDAIFDKEAVAAIGAIAVAPSSSRHVWVGTGEANDRNSSSWGNGVYHSSDGGGSWTNTGLKKSRTIARIVVHPTDSNTVWVAAMGDLWNTGGERGLYKTTDAGKTWRAVLTAPKPYDDRVGCGDVCIDPSNPSVVYAALYARIRKPWEFRSGPDATDGKDAGGIYKSSDGGESWAKLDQGLPRLTGRIGIDISRKNPSVVYAVVQSSEGGTSDIDDVHSKRGGVFRSDDGGAHWTRQSPLNPRPFYFSQIRVDPSNDQKIYVLGYMLHSSDDGGKTFREDYFDKVHPDCHALAIDPKNTKRLLLGTDGGLYESYASGKGWNHINNFSAGEFYRVTADMGTPYRLAGGLQDNLNWVGPSRTFTKDGIVNSDWINLGGGDGFYCVFDPTDSDVVYAESQQGYLHRMNLRTGEAKGLRPQPAEGQEAFRFHWNSPLIGSRHEPGALYLAGNRIFKLSARGEEWKCISPDLSTRATNRILTTGSGAENYGVVYTLAESPLAKGLLWAGTDDGKFWKTTDDGTTWVDLTSQLPSAVRGEWISRVEAGHADAKAVYLAVDAHRSGNFAPLVYRSDDGGKSWKSIAGDLPSDGPVKVIREDVSNPRLLFAGTEFALFMSIDAGATWQKFGGLPTVAVDDILIHPRDRDLVLATHGRSLYVVDDIRPLEQFADSIQKKDAYFFEPDTAFGRFLMEGSADWDGSVRYRGENPPLGATFNVFVREFTGEGVKFSISNSADQTVANLSLPGTPGFARAVWDLRLSKEFLNDYGGEGQKFVKSGDYTVTMSYGKTKQTRKLHVTIAPGIETR